MKHLSLDGQTVTLTRFARPHALGKPTGPVRARGLLLDTETTGVEQGVDDVVELAMVPFEFEPDTGAVISVEEPLDWFNDPGRPIPPEATAVHGITDTDVKGQRIDWTRAVCELARADVVIAHNAAFDRPMLNWAADRHMSEADGSDAQEALAALGLRFDPTRTIWACTFDLLPWPKMPLRSLEVLCAWHGFWYSAHRATADCDALLELLIRSDRLAELYRAATTPSSRVWFPCHIQFKDKLKAHGARWSPGRKCWYVDASDKAKLDAELAWGQACIYGEQPNRAQIERIDPWQRFL